MEEALQVFLALGAAPAADRVRQELRRVGVTRLRRGPRSSTRAHPAGLTRRESEILALLARHLSNPDIGERLFVSPKTVEHHVSAILGKLDVSTRDEAVVEARRRGWLDESPSDSRKIGDAPRCSPIGAVLYDQLSFRTEVIMSAEATIDQLAPSFTGQLLQPSDPGYDDAAASTTGSSTSGPAIIARCRGTADVAEAVKLARTLESRGRGPRRRPQRRRPGDDRRRSDDRSGADEGHPRRSRRSAPRGRRAACCGRSSIARRSSTASPRPAASSARRASPGLTLGGGLGWLMPKYGLALDNLRSAEMVMADGTVCRAAPTRTLICSGRFAAAAATSASPRRSSTASIRSDR